MECLLPYLCMVTVPHITVRLERMLDYRGVILERFHCAYTLCAVYINQVVEVGQFKTGHSSQVVRSRELKSLSGWMVLTFSSPPPLVCM